MSTEGAWGLKYEDVVGLCWLAYKGNNPVKGANYSFPNAGTNWTILDIYKQGGFHAILAQGGEGNKRVLSFSGTDDLSDWIDNASQQLSGISAQYIRAGALGGSVPCDVIVGHSLGGGLASYAHLVCGRPVATINAAPLSWNNILAGRIVNRNFRAFPITNYVVRWEMLDMFDLISGITSNKIGRIVNVGSNGGNPLARHLLPNLTGFVAPVRT